MAVAGFDEGAAQSAAAHIKESVSAGDAPRWTPKEAAVFSEFIAGERNTITPRIRGRVMHNAIRKGFKFQGDSDGPGSV